MSKEITKESVLKDLESIKSSIENDANKVKKMASDLGFSVYDVYTHGRYQNEVKEKYPFAYEFMSLNQSSPENDAWNIQDYENNKDAHIIGLYRVMQLIPKKNQIKFKRFDTEKIHLLRDAMGHNEYRFSIRKEYLNGNTLIECDNENYYNELVSYLFKENQQTKDFVNSLDSDDLKYAQNMTTNNPYNAIHTACEKAWIEKQAYKF